MTEKNGRWEVWGKTRLKDIVDFVLGAKMHVSKDGKTEGSRRSGTDNLGSIASQNKWKRWTWDHKDEKEKDLPFAPGSLEMLWKPGGTYDGPFHDDRMVSHAHTLSGLGTKKRAVTGAGEGSGEDLNEAC